MILPQFTERRKKMNYKLDQIMISEAEIKKRVEELAVEIEKDFHHEPVFLIVVLKGSFVFAADLMRAMEGNVQVDFISVSSYSNQTESTGKVKLLKDLDANITDKNVVIVEDIIDSGLTLHFLRDHLKMHKPKQVKICTLLDKPERRKIDLPVDYVGFVIPDEFIVGYGIDYAQKYRNLPYIATVKQTEQ